MSAPLPVHAGVRALHDLLRARGIDPMVPMAVGPAWTVFQEFVSIPFATATDGILYQIGTYDFNVSREFYLDFVRQFEVLYEDGEHDHYEQLHCEFRFPVTEVTQRFGEFNRWWFADLPPGSWREFVSAVEERREFQALRDATPTAANIWQEEV